MSNIKHFTILLLISSLGLQCADSQIWDLEDIENVDNLFSSWLIYGRQMYYEYQLEADALICILNGIWKVARDHIIEQSRQNLHSSPSKVIEKFNGESIEKYGEITTEESSRAKRSLEKSISSNRKVRQSGLASLLGITGKQFSRDYDRTVVRTKKSVDNSWDNDDGDDDDNDDDVIMGDLERVILKTLVKNHPLVGISLNILGNIIYLIHSIDAFMRSSVVLTCISNYTIKRGTEFIYLNI